MLRVVKQFYDIAVAALSPRVRLLLTSAVGLTAPVSGVCTKGDDPTTAETLGNRHRSPQSRVNPRHPALASLVLCEDPKRAAPAFGARLRRTSYVAIHLDRNGAAGVAGGVRRRRRRRTRGSASRSATSRRAGEDSRVSGDVLNANRCIDTAFVCEPLLFDVGDFGGATFGGEYLVGIGKFFEAGVGVGLLPAHRAEHLRVRHAPDGTEIEQDLKLRIVPLTATLKFVPTGRDAPVPAVHRRRHRGAVLGLQRDRRVRRHR